MKRFEIEVTHLVARFVDQIADLARRASHEKIMQALDGATSSGTKPRKQRAPKTDVTMPDVFRIGLARATVEIQRAWIVRALDQHAGNISKAARALRTNRQGLQRKIQRLQIASHADRRPSSTRRP